MEDKIQRNIFYVSIWLMMTHLNIGERVSASLNQTVLSTFTSNIKSVNDAHNALNAQNDHNAHDAHIALNAHNAHDAHNAHNPEPEVLNNSATAKEGTEVLADIYHGVLVPTFQFKAQTQTEESGKYLFRSQVEAKNKARLENVTKVLDLSRQYIARKGLGFLVIYWTGDKTPLLRWLRPLIGELPVAVRACPAEPSGRSLRKVDNHNDVTNRNGLHLVLCGSSTKILENEFRNDESPSFIEGQRRTSVHSLPHWMLADTCDLSDLTYIPLDASVLKVRKSTDASYSLEAVWTPAPGSPLRSAPVGCYQPDYCGHYDSNTVSHSVIGQLQICSFTDGKGQLCLADDRLIREKSNLTGVHLVMTTVPPKETADWSFNKKLGRFVLTGSLGDMLEAMHEVMNFTYSVVTPKDLQYGRERSNGSWTGMVGDVVSGRADIVLAYLSRDLARDGVLDFSPSVGRFSFRVFARRPGTAGYQWQAYLRSFTTSLWGCVVLVYLVLAGVFAFVSRVSVATQNPEMSQNERTSNTPGLGVRSRNATVTQSASHTMAPEERDGESGPLNYSSSLDERMGIPSRIVDEENHPRMGKKNFESFSNKLKCGQNWMAITWNSCFVIWTAFMQQGHPMTPRGAALRVLFLVNYLLGVLLLTSYSAMLVSFLTVVDSSLPFTSLQSLADHGRYRLGIINASSSSNFMQSPTYLPLYDRLVKPYPDTQPDSYDELRLRARNDPYYAYLSTRRLESTGDKFTCSIKDSKVDIRSDYGALAYRKGFHFALLFNHYLAVLSESGLKYEFALKNYRRPFCSEESDMSLKFSQVFTAFLVLAGGGAVALLVLLLELLTKGR